MTQGNLNSTESKVLENKKMIFIGNIPVENNAANNLLAVGIKSLYIDERAFDSRGKRMPGYFAAFIDEADEELFSTYMASKIKKCRELFKDDKRKGISIPYFSITDRGTIHLSVSRNRMICTLLSKNKYPTYLFGLENLPYIAEKNFCKKCFPEGNPRDWER